MAGILEPPSTVECRHTLHAASTEAQAQMALRTIAARPMRAPPTSRSLAESGTGENREFSVASDAETARIDTGDETTEADGAATTPAREYFATGCGSIDRAYPTGTTNAATIAASTRIRYRFRIPARIFKPRL